MFHLPYHHIRLQPASQLQVFHLFQWILHTLAKEIFENSTVVRSLHSDVFFPFKWIKLNPNFLTYQWKLPIPWKLPPSCLPPESLVTWGESPPCAPSPRHHYKHICTHCSFDIGPAGTRSFKFTSSVRKAFLNYAGPFWWLPTLYFLWSVPHSWVSNYIAVFHGPRIISCILVSSFQINCKQLEGRDHIVHFPS